MKTILLIIALVIFASPGMAASLANDALGCQEKIDLYTCIDHARDGGKTTRAFVNIGKCVPLPQGKKVKLIQHSKMWEYQFSQVEADGRKLWVISDFLYR